MPAEWRRPLSGWVLLAGFVVFISGGLLGATNAPDPTYNDFLYTQAGIALFQFAVILVVSRRAFVDLAEPSGVIIAAFLITVLLAYLSVSVWPNSGDEYGYTYLARTFLQGRLWNAPPPVLHIFDFDYIFEKNGMLVSQYAPGWPAVLAVFLAAGVEQLANPVLTLLMGLLFAATLRRLQVPSAGVAPLTALVMLAPYTLFNGASLFPHTLAACAVTGICWLQLRDDAAPHWINKAAIGFTFAVLLTVRYEVFAVVLSLYVVERIWRRRSGFVRDAIIMALGGLPITAAFMGYNWAITGNPLLPVLTRVNPTFGASAPTIVDSKSSLSTAFWHQRVWFGELCEYAGVSLVGLYGLGLVRNLRQRTLRFFDAIPIGCVAFFFFFFPENGLGGHQFGPRYWYFAWPAVGLTAGAALRDTEGWITVLRHRIHLPSFAALQVVGFLGTTLVVAGLFRVYVDLRREVYLVQPPQLPAVVLLPAPRPIVVAPWQPRPYYASDHELSRNGTDFNGPILYGYGGTPQAAEIACSLPGRTVYRWQSPGKLEKVDCEALPGATTK
jgi:hypothetical protein